MRSQPAIPQPMTSQHGYFGGIHYKPPLDSTIMKEKSGKKSTKPQLQLSKRKSSNVRIFLDGDDTDNRTSNMGDEDDDIYQKFGKDDFDTTIA